MEYRKKRRLVIFGIVLSLMVIIGVLFNLASVMGGDTSKNRAGSGKRATNTPVDTIYSFIQSMNRGDSKEAKAFLTKEAEEEVEAMEESSQLKALNKFMGLEIAPSKIASVLELSYNKERARVDTSIQVSFGEIEKVFHLISVDGVWKIESIEGNDTWIRYTLPIGAPGVRVPQTWSLSEQLYGEAVALLTDTTSDTYLLLLALDQEVPEELKGLMDCSYVDECNDIQIGTVPAKLSILRPSADEVVMTVYTEDKNYPYIASGSTIISQGTEALLEQIISTITF